jgi:hypothetical protein
MPYKVQFVGLVCFYRQGGARLALLPDGRNPGFGIDPHKASILVDPTAVEESDGWANDANTSRGIYFLPECSISIEPLDTAGTLDTSAHDAFLPQLRQIDPSFEIDPDTAATIARLPVRQGTLSVHTVPEGDALMSQLLVPHDGTITVTVTPKDGPPRSLCLAAGTEILLGNMADGGIYTEAAQSDGHFRIYEKLSASANPVALQEPSTVPAAEPSDSDHWFFQLAQPINLSVSCSNTGCCGG